MQFVQAHRGASAYAPENTLPAFKKAIEMGADGVECDISTTSDGHWVVMHDSTVDRTTNGTGKITDLSLQQIKTLNIDFGSKIKNSLFERSKKIIV